MPLLVYSVASVMAESSRRIASQGVLPRWSEKAHYAVDVSSTHCVLRTYPCNYWQSDHNVDSFTVVAVEP